MIDNDTLLFVTSDHGLTKYGNHGGNSEAETSSFVFGYTKKGFRDEVYDPKYKKIMG